MTSGNQGILWQWNGIGAVSILLCLLGICNLVLSIRQKKKLFFGVSLCLVCIGAVILSYAYVVLQGYGTMTRAWLLWLAFLPLWGIAGWDSYGNLRWNQTHVTPLSIQESFEKLTEGICYYREGGQCILVNGSMQEICRMLTGRALRNGEEFANAVFGKGESKIITMGNGQIKGFSKRRVSFAGEEVWEILAADLTELYGKTRQLQAENERLRDFQKHLTEYHAEQRDTVRREEILAAKMSIHDEMNRLLLSTRNAMARGDFEEGKKVLLSWKNNALLLCREAQGTSDAEALRDLHVIAASMGIELLTEGDISMTQEALTLFVAATREAMVNAVKHAGAQKLFVTVGTESDGTRTVIYKNDGAPPAEPVRAAGGLINLRQRLEKAGGSMEIASQPEFCLTVRIPQA
ncbi:MAG: hypothetical protein K6F51_10450 [Acetatifactor sp.]|nr:hypothetical protein [Acetatifactor sp.]